MKILKLKTNVINIDNIAYTVKEAREQLAIHFIGIELPLIVKGKDREAVLKVLHEEAYEDAINRSVEENTDDMQ